MRRTFVLEFGACGWGTSGGLVPELRLGYVRLWTSHSSVAGQLSYYQYALGEAIDLLKEMPSVVGRRQ